MRQRLICQYTAEETIIISLLFIEVSLKVFNQRIMMNAIFKAYGRSLLVIGWEIKIFHKSSYLGDRMIRKPIYFVEKNDIVLKSMFDDRLLHHLDHMPWRWCQWINYLYYYGKKHCIGQVARMLRVQVL